MLEGALLLSALMEDTGAEVAPGGEGDGKVEDAGDFVFDDFDPDLDIDLEKV